MTRFQRIYYKWLIFFTIVCVINSITIIGFLPGLKGNYLDDFLFAFLLPFIHCGLTWILMMTYAFYYIAVRYLRDGDPSLYVKQKYPQLWKKLHPLGDYSKDSISYFQFYRRKYDDGSDSQLNQIRSVWMNWDFIRLWTFFLVPVIWMFNLLLVYARVKFTGYELIP